MTHFNKILNNFLFNSKNIILFSLIFFIFRIIISIFFIDFYNTIEDYTIAKNLVNGFGYTLFLEDGITAFKAPFYPLLLTVFIFIFNTGAKLAIVIFQHFLLSLIPILLLKLGNSTSRKEIGYVSAWLFLIHPAYFYYPNVIEPTNVFILFSLISIIIGIESLKKTSQKSFILLGLLFGIILLIQPIVALILFAFLIFLLLKREFKKFTIVFSITLLVVSPWIIRNYIEFDKFIPGKSPFWLNFYVGYLPYYHANAKYNLLNKEDIRTIDSLKTTSINDVEMEKYYKKFFLRAINKSPVIYIEKTFYQMASYWWIPPKYFNDNRIQFILIRKLPVAILNLLTIVGFYFMFKTDKKYAVCIFAILFYFTAVYGLTQVANIRFKLDIEWLQLIVVSYFIIGRWKL